MPNIKSAIKRVQVTKVKNARNRTKRSELRTTLRTFRETIDAKASNAGTVLLEAIKKVDQAAAKNLIHKNTAARKKSQLQRAYNAINVK